MADVRPGVAFLFHILFLIAMAFGLARLELRNNDDADLPESDPIVRTNEKFEEIFGGKDRVLISLESDDAFTPESLTATREISDAFVGLDWVVGNEIKSLSKVKHIEPSDDGLKVDVLYGSETLDAAVAKDIRRKAESNPLIWGRVVSEDGRASLILINVVRGSDQAKVYQDTYRILERYRARFNVRVIGDLILSEAIDRGIQEDAVILFPVAILLQLLVLYIVFRRIGYVIACVSVTIVSIVWTMGLMGWFGYPVTVVTTSVPILISVIASAYSIHFVHAHIASSAGASSTDEALGFAAAKVLKPLLIACVTSAVGAFSLIVFKVAAIAEFGVVTATGTICSLFVVLTLLPAMIRTLPVKPKANDSSLKPVRGSTSERMAGGLTRLGIRYPKPTLAIYVAFLAVSILSITLLRTGANFADYLPDAHATRQDMAYFDTKLGGSRYFEILVESENANGVQSPEFLKTVSEIQSYAETLPYVGKTMSFVDIIKRIDAVLDGKPSGRIPDTYDQASQYLLLYSISSSPEDFSDLVDYDHRRIKIFVPVKTSEQDIHQQIYRDLRNRIESLSGKNRIHVEYGGNLLVWLAQMDYIIVGKIQNIITSVIVVIVLCAAFFRSLKYALIAAAPIALSILCTFGVMALLDIRLEVSTAVITGISIGIGIDFSCHFLHHYLKSPILHDTTGSGAVVHRLLSAVSASGASIIFNIAVTVIGFSAFIFSAFKPIQNFGYLISSNMIFSGIATFSMIPALVVLTDRERALRLGPEKKKA